MVRPGVLPGPETGFRATSPKYQNPFFQGNTCLLVFRKASGFGLAVVKMGSLDDLPLVARWGFACGGKSLWFFHSLRPEGIRGTSHA
jgi:hypothetical protein